MFSDTTQPLINPQADGKSIQTRQSLANMLRKETTCYEN